MKRAILLLLSFLAVVSMSAVSAINTDYSQWNDNVTTDYYVICEEDDNLLKDLLDNADWLGYAPKVVNIKNHIVYFASKNDLYRAISAINENEEKTFAHIKAICDGGELQTITAIYVEGANEDGPPTGSDAKITFRINKNDTKVVFVTYCHGSILYGTSWNKLDGNSIGFNVIKTYYLNAGTHTYSCKGDAYSGNYGTLATTILIFDKNINYTVIRPGNSVKKLYEIIPMYSLEVYSEPGAQVYIDGNNVGTTDNGGYIKLLIEKGTHELKITKEGFWDYVTTINIQNDTTLHIDLTPKNSIFRVTENITSNLYPNSIGDVKLHLEPIRTAYGAQMTISGVDVVKVYYKNALLAPSSGAYVLGTVDSPVDVEIQFKTPQSWGDHSFAITITASDIEGNQYTTQKQITYNVKELPFLLQTPDTWKIGDNVVTITDQSGDDYSVLLTLKDLNGTEIWSQSQGFNAYDSYDFVVPINQSGDYVLEIVAKGGEVKTYIPVHVIDPIKLLTKEVNATKGSVATVKLEIQNPSSEVKYYDAKLLGEIFDVNNTPKQTFSVAPGETKVVELKFEVPKNLTYDSYNLKVEVFEKGEASPIFESDIVLKIVEGSLLPIGLGDIGIPIWALVAGIILLGGIGAYILMRR